MNQKDLQLEVDEKKIDGRKNSEERRDNSLRQKKKRR